MASIISDILGELLNGILLVGSLVILTLMADAERFEYEYDLLCSQSRHIVGYSEGGGIYMKTPYVNCNEDLGSRHNFTRTPHVEKKYVETL